MKHSLRIASVAAAVVMTAGIANAYNVSDQTQKKHILFETFTGKTCMNCPEGDRELERLKAEKGDNMHIISMHVNTYAAGTPNYRTDMGTALDGYFRPASYPSACINRHTFLTNTWMSPPFWAQYADQVAQEDAPVNLWMEVGYDPDTRLISVALEGYVTATINNSGKANLTVAMIQNHIIGDQLDVTMRHDYEHNWMLRDYLTPGTWGEALTGILPGEYFTRSYEYTLPEKIGDVDVVPENLSFIAFVTKNNEEVANATESKIMKTTTVGANVAEGKALTTVYDLNGRQVLTLSGAELDTSALASGLYIVRTQRGSDVDVRKVLVK